MGEMAREAAHVLRNWAVFALNGGLFTAYALWWNLDKLLVLLSAAPVLLYFDARVQERAVHTPRRHERGSATAKVPRTAQAMTLVTLLAWLGASFLSSPPIPVIGAAMWAGMVLGLLIMPHEWEQVLWRCKSYILTYALAVLGFVFYLRLTEGLSPEEWASLLGGVGEARRVIAQNRGMFVTVASWGLWLLAPLGYFSILIQRFTVNPMSAVAPWKSAAEIVRDIRTRGEE